MVRQIAMTLVAALVWTGSTWAQSLPRWHWQKGQSLTYKSEQATQASDIFNTSANETSTRLNVVKRWDVLEVDAAGIATVSLKLLSLKLETKTPSGEFLQFDSTNPEKSTPQLKDSLTAFVGPTLGVLRVDNRGRVMEVKESKFGPASKYENELPFVGILPETTPRLDSTWERDYHITLAPPQGTGEQFAAQQRYRMKNVTSQTMTIQLATELKTQPAAPADRVPLLQLLPEGEFVFDMKAGRLLSAELRIDKTLQNHRGQGTSHRFQSITRETLVEK
jgi:hypothetical protein